MNVDVLLNGAEVKNDNPFPVKSAGSVVTTVEVTIASGASISAAVDLGGKRIARIVMPAEWTAANLTFQTGLAADTCQNLYDGAGLEVTEIVDAARNVSPANPIALSDLVFIKVRSGTSGTAVNQAAARTIKLILA